MDSKLAIHGGPRTLASQRALRFLKLRRGLSRTWDLLPLLAFTLRGNTTIKDGTGIVGRFERRMCEATGARHALAMNSGTATLHSAYFAVGVGPGSEVIVPAYTWHASATPVLQCSAVPVFCEVDPRTLTLDPDDVERRITPRTRAICAVHVWGNPAPMDRICAIAERHGIPVIEDCSHAHGASYQGRPVGTFGSIGCFSLQGAKAVDAGEGGVAITDDPVLYDRMALLGHNVTVKLAQRANTFPDFGDVSLGVKYRPHVAAMYLADAALRQLPARNRRAARVWQWLCEELEGVAGIRAIETLPGAVRGGYYAFAFEYTGEDLGGPDTEAFVAAVTAEGAPILFDQFRGRLLHTLPLFRSFDRRTLGGACFDPTRPWEENLSAHTSLPVTERLANRLVAFPRQMYGVPESFVRACAGAVKKVLAGLLPAAAGATAPMPPDVRTRPIAAGGASR
jgi:dTDP-4-amino-4,6-dideoxygalactose transaminase